MAVALVLGYVAVSAAAAMGPMRRHESGGYRHGAAAAATATAPAAAVKPPIAEPAVPIAPPEAVVPDAPEPPADAGTGDTIQTTIAGDGTIELHAKNEDLANVLEMLSQKYQLNIIVTPRRQGPRDGGPVQGDGGPGPGRHVPRQRPEVVARGQLDLRLHGRGRHGGPDGRVAAWRPRSSR